MTYQASLLGSSIRDPPSLTVLLSRDQNCSHPPWLLGIYVSVSGNLDALAILRPQVGRLQRLLTFSSRAVESLQVTIICAEKPEGGLTFATGACLHLPLWHAITRSFFLGLWSFKRHFTAISQGTERLQQEALSHIQIITGYKISKACRWFSWKLKFLIFF